MKAIKSIFGSKVEEDTYKYWMKRKKKINGHILPQIPLSAFINFEKIKDLLSPAEKDYFFKSRVDFLICNKKFEPIVIIEIDGYYHKYNTLYDKMKDKICQVAEINISRFEGDDIPELKYLFD